MRDQVRRIIAGQPLEEFVPAKPRAADAAASGRHPFAPRAAAIDRAAPQQARSSRVGGAVPRDRSQNLGRGTSACRYTVGVFPRPSFDVPLPTGGTLHLGDRTLIMGVLNVTPDSFADGGLHRGPCPGRG